MKRSPQILPSACSLALTLLAVLIVAPNSARAQFSGFGANDEGWQIVSFADISARNFTVIGSYSPTYFSSGGDPGGYIYTTDPDGGDFTFSAPTAFLGDQSATYGSKFTYSLSYSSSSVNYHTSDVILMGGGVTLLWQQNPMLVPSSAFATVSVPLAPSTEWRLVNGNVATVSDFTTVLGNLSGIYIRGEFAFGPDSTGLDNVRFASVPEPESWALMAAGLGVLAWRWRRRKRA